MRALLLTAALLVAPAARGDTVTRPFAGVTVEQLYDSNVMNSRGDDGVTRVTPRVGALIENRTWTFAGDYRLGLHAYARGTADNSINHRGAGRMRWHATPRLDFNAELVLLNGDDPVLLDRLGVAIPQGGFFDLTAIAGTSYRLTRRTDLGLAYTYRRSRFDLAEGPEPLAFDGDEHRVDLGVSHRLTRRLTGRALARAQRFVAFGAESSLGTAVGGGAGAEYRLTERTRARAFAGPLWFSGSADGLGWFGGGDLIRIGERWRLALRALHDVYGGTSAREAVWSDSLSSDGTLRLTKRMDLRVRAGAYRSGTAPNYDPDVTGLMGRAELSFLVLRQVRLDVYAEHRAQDAGGGVAFGDVQRSVAGVRISTVIGTEITSMGDLP